LEPFFQKYIYPKKAKNVHGEWHYIINTDKYKQGVTVELCLPTTKGQFILELGRARA
jgi:hypothetical protein